MKHYTYKLMVTNKSTLVRTFYGNDTNELQERFELWFVKTGYDRADVETRLDYVQHAGRNAR